MADELVGLDSGGCVTPIANGTVGQVMTIGADGKPAWISGTVDCEFVQDCVGTAVAGTSSGITYNDASNTFEVAIAPAQGGVNNATSIIAGAGLYTPAVTIDPDTCNGLTNSATGLLAPAPTYVRSAQGTFPYMAVPIDVSGGFPGQDMGTVTVAITNPSACLDMIAVYNANADGKMILLNGAGVGIYLRLAIDLNGTVTNEAVVKGHSSLAAQNEALRINAPIFDMDAPIGAISRVFTIPPSGYLQITMAVTAFYSSTTAHVAGNNQLQAGAEATLYGVNTQ